MLPRCWHIWRFLNTCACRALPFGALRKGICSTCPVQPPVQQAAPHWHYMLTCLMAQLLLPAVLLSGEPWHALRQAVCPWGQSLCTHLNGHVLVPGWDRWHCRTLPSTSYQCA